nr:hypothetical protein [uncultured Desulfobulbus sp.]
MEHDIQEQIKKSPIVWFFGTLITGFLAGVALMTFLQNYSGMSLITKQELLEKNSNIETLKRESAILTQKISESSARVEELQMAQQDLITVTAEQEKAIVELKKSKDENKLLREELQRTQLTLETERKKSTHLDTSEKENSKLTRQNAALNAKINELQSANRALNMHLEEQQVHYNELTKPRTAKNYSVIAPSQSIRPNQIVEFLDGILTVNAQYIARSGACLTTNTLNECVFIEVSRTLPIQIRNKKYAIRVDSTNTNVFNDGDRDSIDFMQWATREDNSAMITLLLVSTDS